MSTINTGNSLSANVAIFFFVDPDTGLPTEIVNGNVATAHGSATVASGTGYLGDTRDLMQLTAATSDYFELPADASYAVTGAMTIAWFGNISSGGGYRHFIGKGVSNGSDQTPYDFRTDNSTPPFPVLIRSGTSGAGAHSAAANTAVTIGSPQGVLVKQDGTDLVLNSRHWVNGTEASVTQSNTTGAATDSGAVVKVGRRDDGAVQMDGYTELVVVWARLLSDAEIDDFFANPYQLLATPLTYGHGTAR